MSEWWRAVRSERLSRWALASALLFGALVGVFLPRMAAQAQANSPQTYSVLAGSAAEFNTAVLAFAPQSLKVHRGDTVTWILGGFHNIHFETTISDLIVAPEVNGQPQPQLNPAVAFPSIEDGGVFTGGDANSGVALDPTNPVVTFSMVMDVAPGSYSYFCDIHPGMVGAITVVDAATAIPSPVEVLSEGAAQLAADGGQALGAAMAAASQPATANPSGVEVKAGLQAGPAAVLQFFPAVAVIHAGQSVTWSLDPHSMEPHFVAWPQTPPGAEFKVMPQDSAPPIIGISEVGLGSTASGTEIANGDSFNSGFLMPGQSFTLTFTEPGVYNYVCSIHAGMQGAIVVMPST